MTLVAADHENSCRHGLCPPTGGCRENHSMRGNSLQDRRRVCRVGRPRPRSALSAASRNLCEVVCPGADLCEGQPGDTLVTKAISIHAGALRGVKKQHEKTKGGSPKGSALDAESFGGNASCRPVAYCGDRISQIVRLYRSPAGAVSL